MSSISSIKKGMQKRQDGITSATQRLNTVDKVERLEKFCNQMWGLVQAMNKNLEKLNQRASFLETSVSALIALAGPDKVKAQVAEDRKASLEAEAEQHALNVATALKEGHILETEEIAPQTLLVFQDKTLEGEIRFPTKVHMEFEDMPPAYQEALLGKKVGNVINVAESILTILAVYKNAPQPETKE